jgi:hypothetical protein
MPLRERVPGIHRGSMAMTNLGRLLARVGVLLTLAVGSAGGWAATQQVRAHFIVPDATDIQEVTRGWDEWQIRYQVPGVPTTWLTDVSRQLEAQRWGSSDRAGYGGLTRNYSRAVRFGPCELWEWAFLTFDPLQPHIAQITVRRAIVFPWLRRLLP